MTTTLKTLLNKPPGVHAPGAYDGFSALMVERAGFEAVYLSGGSIAYSLLGRPDIGLVSMTEVADVVMRIRDRIDIPIIVDGDTGFGNALNVQRTVRLFERAGANAIQIEDQTSPKRCGHLADKSVVSVEEMVGKIRAAIDARRYDDTLIIARTDAIGVEGFDAAMERARAYLSAGADALFIEAPQSLEQMQTICAEFSQKVPLVANMVEGGKTPIMDRDALFSMGFRLVISPGALMRAQAPVMEALLAHIREHGSTIDWRDRMLDLMGLNERLGLAQTLEHGARYQDKAVKD